MESKLYTKKADALRLLLTGTLLVGLGIFILNTGLFTLRTFFYLFGLGFILLGVSNLIRIAVKKIRGKENAIHLSNILVNIGLGLLIIQFPQMQISIFGVICGLYSLLLGCIQALNYFLLKHNHVREFALKAIVLCLFYFGLGILLLFSPYFYISVVLNIIAVYFILYGITYYQDGLREIIPIKHKDKIKRKIRITLPVFIEALIPSLVLEEVNRFLTPSDEKSVDATPDFVERKGDERADIEVFVHMSPKGFGIIGHVDIGYQGKMISYGNYDTESQRFFETIGDGVLFLADQEQYIPFVIKDSEKTLVSFGLKLNELQKKQVQKRMDEVRSTLRSWTPPESKNEKDYYATRLNGQVLTEFYKFKKGKFKTYFVVGENCVRFADYIIGGAGIDGLKMNGVITPGTYYEYLNTKFASKDMLVISKKIYN